jgi:hypothetical protein
MLYRFKRRRKMKTLPIALMVWGLMGIAGLGICGGNEKVKKEMIHKRRQRRKLFPLLPP